MVSNIILGVIVAVVTSIINHIFFNKQLKKQKSEDYKYDRIPKIIGSLYEDIMRVKQINNNPMPLGIYSMDLLKREDRELLKKRQEEIYREINNSITYFQENSFKEILVSCDIETLDYFLKIGNLLKFVNDKVDVWFKGFSSETNKHLANVEFMYIAYLIEGIVILKKQINDNNISIASLEKLFISENDRDWYNRSKEILIEEKIF